MNDLAIPNLHTLGEDRGNGNLLGISPYVVPQDYASVKAFHQKLDTYLATAQREHWLNEKTIVVFPEYVGTWLVLVNESQAVYQAPTMQAAERALVVRHPFRFGRFWITARERGRAEAAFFRMKAGPMAESYQAVCSRLARDYTVTLIAGSIFLPSPIISGGRLILTEGPLRNVSLVYAPDGNLHPQPIYKAFPTAQELPLVTPGLVGDIPVFETPAGRLGVLICADSWFPLAYETLQKNNVTLVAVPSFNDSGPETWNVTWPGYSGWPVPDDVDVRDIKSITEAEAWAKYSLGGRIQFSGAAYGVRVFLRGQLWDMDLGGWSGTLVRDDEIFVEPPTQKAALLNTWL